MLDITKKLQTRCGLPVTILVTDLKGPFPLGGIIHNVVDFKKEEKEIVRGWKLNGRYLECEEDHPYDLMNVKCKEEGWACIDPSFILNSKEAAENAFKLVKNSNKFVVAKIEWYR